MKLDFTPPTDGKVHQYCINCHAETVRQIEKDGRGTFVCDTCGQTSNRSLYFDNRIYWLDEEGELWHETAAVFVRNADGKFLFFNRTLFPFGLTVAAGHVDNGETPEVSAVRELQEEVGVQSKRLRHALDTDIIGDKCSSGADAHKWHVYVEAYDGDGNIEVLEEGKDPVWLSLDEAATHEMPVAIRYLLENHAAAIEGR